MTDSITNSSELRQFAAENSGRRKIDVDVSLELHRRAANQIDLLTDHIAELRRQTRQGETGLGATPDAAPSVVGEPSQAALIMLQNAQATADRTIAEAEALRADAERLRAEADVMAQAKGEAAISEARGEAAHIIEAAEARASEVAAASAVAADRVAFAERQYRERVAMLRSEAESVVEIARGMETLAEEEPSPALTQQPFTEPISSPAIPAAVAAPAVETVASAADLQEIPAPPAAEVTTPAEEPELVEQLAPLPPPPPPEVEDIAAPDDQPHVDEPAHVPAAHSAVEDEIVLPPPPAPVATTDLPPPPAGAEGLIDLTERELEEALGGKSIDDELFGEDVVIDLSDEPAPSGSQGFEFFSRD